MKIFKTGVIIIMGILLSLDCKAQDLHYSQFYNSPLNLNPALTGVFNGDQRFNTSLRDQWRYVPVPWTTFSAAYDRKLEFGNNERNLFGIGGNFNYDRQGASRLNLTSLNVAGSYSRVIKAHHILTGGLLLGISNRGFNPNDLTWDRQWDGDAFNPNDPSGENFDSERVTFLETGLGVNYRLQKSSRTKLDAGVGVYHLIEPATTFYNTDDKKLPKHYTLSAIGSVKLFDPLDIELHFLQQLQEEYIETVFGGIAKIYVSQKRGKEIQLHAGIGYRTAKSFIPTLAVQYNAWYVSLSYDFDDTELNQLLNSNMGGPEIHVRYIITNVKPLDDRKVCPIY